MDDVRARADTESRLTLIYDGDCQFCTAVQRLVRRWDRTGHIELIPSQDSTIPSRFPALSFAGCTEAMHLIDAQGRDWQGAEAVRELLNVLPGGRGIGWIFRIPGVPWIAARAYRIIARHRYVWGRTGPPR